MTSLSATTRRDSSATALAFRRALQLDPGLQAGGLAQVDSALERILVAERQALASDAPAAPPAAAPPPAPHGASGASSPFGPMHDCVRRCRGGETKPEVIQRPQLPRVILADRLSWRLLAGRPVRVSL